MWDQTVLIRSETLHRHPLCLPDGPGPPHLPPVLVLGVLSHQPSTKNKDGGCLFFKHLQICHSGRFLPQKLFVPASQTILLVTPRWDTPSPNVPMALPSALFSHGTHRCQQPPPSPRIHLGMNPQSREWPDNSLQSSPSRTMNRFLKKENQREILPATQELCCSALSLSKRWGLGGAPPSICVISLEIAVLLKARLRSFSCRSNPSAAAY